MKIEEIQKLCDEASPAPWGYECPHTHDDDPEKYYEVRGPDCCNDGPSYAEVDAKFIAASRTLMPKLLAIAKAAKPFEQLCAQYHVFGGLVAYGAPKKIAEDDMLVDLKRALDRLNED